MDPLQTLPLEPSTWEAHARALDPDARWALGQAIAQEWVEGRLEPRLLGPDAGRLTALRHGLASVLAACGVAEHLEIEWAGTTVTEALARRWCWIAPWRLFSQDEDLFLMDDRFIVALLEEAAAGCTKRQLVCSIAEHHIRDQVHTSLRVGPDAVRARIRELVRFRSAALAAGAASLDAYLNRLESYERPQKVRLEDARARVSDVWRCHAPASVEFEPFSRGEFRAKYSAGSGREEWIVVEEKTGSMRLEQVNRAPVDPSPWRT